MIHAQATLRCAGGFEPHSACVVCYRREKRAAGVVLYQRTKLLVGEPIISEHYVNEPKK
jgi:hypothetical protein